MCNYFVEHAHAFFMCLAKTEVFNYVYELSKGEALNQQRWRTKFSILRASTMSVVPALALRAFPLTHDELEDASYLLTQTVDRSGG